MVREANARRGAVSTRMPEAPVISANTTGGEVLSSSG
jgi:hypothetical protein